MTNEGIIDKNLEQYGRFMLYVLEHPEFLDTIPGEAEVIFLPEDDPEPCQVNERVGKEKEAVGVRVVYLKVSLVPRLQVLKQG